MGSAGVFSRSAVIQRETARAPHQGDPAQRRRVVRPPIERLHLGDPPKPNTLRQMGGPLRSRVDRPNRPLHRWRQKSAVDRLRGKQVQDKLLVGDAQPIRPPVRQPRKDPPDRLPERAPAARPHRPPVFDQDTPLKPGRVHRYIEEASVRELQAAALRRPPQPRQNHQATHLGRAILRVSHLQDRMGTADPQRLALFGHPLLRKPKVGMAWGPMLCDDERRAHHRGMRPPPLKDKQVPGLRLVKPAGEGILRDPQEFLDVSPVCRQVIRIQQPRQGKDA